MIRLAMETDILNLDGQTQQEKFNLDLDALEAELARYAWYYYVLGRPLVGNSYYDELKREYLSALGIDNEPGKQTKPEERNLTKEELIKYLTENNIRYVDRTSTGGAFWIEQTDISKELVNGITMNGRRLEVAANSKALGNVPAFYYRA